MKLHNEKDTEGGVLKAAIVADVEFI